MLAAAQCGRTIDASQEHALKKKILFGVVMVPTTTD
jgi:hypothetical protein